MEVNGGSRAVLGQPGLPEFREGSSTGPGGFAGHLGVPASAIMPDVDWPAPTHGEVAGDDERG